MSYVIFSKEINKDGFNLIRPFYSVFVYIFRRVSTSDGVQCSSLKKLLRSPSSDVLALPKCKQKHCMEKPYAVILFRSKQKVVTNITWNKKVKIIIYILLPNITNGILNFSLIFQRKWSCCSHTIRHIQSRIKSTINL